MKPQPALHPMLDALKQAVAVLSWCFILGGWAAFAFLPTLALKVVVGVVGLACLLLWQVLENGFLFDPADVDEFRSLLRDLMNVTLGQALKYGGALIGTLIALSVLCEFARWLWHGLEALALAAH